MNKSGVACVVAAWVCGLGAVGGAAGLLGGCAGVRYSEVATAESVEPGERQTNLLVLGDWGTDGGPQRRVAAAMNRYALEEVGPGNLEAVLLTGDNFYGWLSGVTDPKWDRLFEEMYSAEAMPVPFYAVLGNHDYESGKHLAQLGYQKHRPWTRWRMPGRWYTVEIPEDDPQVTVIAVDSNRGSLTDEEWSAQRRWLEAELARPRETRWLIVMGHHPLRAGGWHGGDPYLREEWGPLFERHGVDFYLAGHEHNLQHQTIRDHPTSLVVSGGGGRSVRPGRVSSPPGGFIANTYGFVHMRLGETSADVVYVDGDGRVIYAFSKEPIRGGVRAGVGAE